MVNYINKKKPLQHNFIDFSGKGNRDDQSPQIPFT